MFNKLTPKKIFILVASIVMSIILLFSAGSLIEFNPSGNIKVMQSISGKISVHPKPGPFIQAFGTIWDYDKAAFVYLSNDPLDGGKNKYTDAIPVRFNDAANAKIDMILQFRMPIDEPSVKNIQEIYAGSFDKLKYSIKQQAINAIKNTATLYNAEEAYSTKREEFERIAKEQLINGIYKKESKEVTRINADGKRLVDTKVLLALNKANNPIISKKSLISDLNIEIIGFEIKNIDFDKSTDDLLRAKKKSEQDKVKARAAAERAKQNSITAREEGKADVAKAKAKEEVAKIKAVTQAQKEKEVAELKAQKELAVAKLNKLAAEENSKAKLIAGQAEARVAKLKVQAGLTPKEKAEIEMQTRIGVAAHLSKLQLPKLMVIGSNGKGTQVDPFTAVGLESMMKITEKMSK